MVYSLQTRAYSPPLVRALCNLNMRSFLSPLANSLLSSLVFPEMKTALRTYHPVPALQRTNGNLQDAPRIKNILKTCFLQDETQGTVTTPNDVLARSVSMTLFLVLLDSTASSCSSESTPAEPSHIRRALSMRLIR